LQALVLCLDISESMGYGEPVKLSLALNAIRRTIQSLNRKISIGLVTFDVAAEIALDLQPSNREEIRETLGRIVPRGVTCIAAGLTEAINLIEGRGLKGDVLLLTDGRANLSLNRMGGFEGSLTLEEELLKLANEASQKNVKILTVAVGEDAFTYTLSSLSMKTSGRYWLAEDFLGLTAEPIPTPRTIKVNELKVHNIPAELPSAQPTWTKESQTIHVSVVSQSLYEDCRAHHRAFLVNPSNGREARTALIPIESEALSGYRERRTKTTNEVRNGETILLDRSYRDYLALDNDTPVKLIIY